MRAPILAVVCIVAFAGLTGCMGAGKDAENTDTPIDQTSTSPGSSTSGNTAPPLKVLAPLTSAVTIDAPAWVASGTEVPVSLAAPANAKGAVSYTWAIGPLPGTTTVTPAKADTGSKGSDYIQAGATKSITYGTSGIYRMHCHPHPAMRHNVTVIEGFAGPKTVEVSIVDGASPSEYRYVPENIVVGVGTVVNYKNVGAQPHTATALGTQEPALKKLPLAAATGNVKIEGNGWQRVVAVFQDSEGRFGIAEEPIYTTASLPAFAKQEIAVSFEAATPGELAGTPAEIPAEAVPVTLEQGGLVSINGSYVDAVGGSPVGAAAGQNLAEVELHFTKDGETQDTLTGDAAATHALTGKAQAGQYTLRVVPVQGAQISGTIVIEVVYELVPPPPTAPSAGGEEGHGGHAH